MSAPEESKTAIRPSGLTATRPAESAADATARFTPGTLLAGRYRIISPLGKGGMGEVFRADDVRLGQTVALKFLPAAFAADPGRLQRLVDEVRIGRQISHPNVCRLYDIGETDGQHYMVMEYVDGEDLSSLLRRIGRLPGPKALELARGLCAGLAAAHDKGIIHRDLKPANVMIDGRGHARIADFGLAALADGVTASDMSGTPHYMAPEQLTGGAATLRSDVYALGLVLQEAVTGKRVFEARSLNELRELHARSSIPGLANSASDVDPGLSVAIHRCLSREPQARPASAREVLLLLPGGDPLQAALLAGETPSPEMVAAAAEVGDLSPMAALSLLLTAMVLLVGLVLASSRALYRQAALEKSPEVLADRARDVLARLGYRGPARDRASGFVIDDALVRRVRASGSREEQSKLFGSVRPGAYLFFYRESPEPFAPNSWIPAAPWEGAAQIGRILSDDPPLTVPGMTRVVVDSRGRLVGFRAVPAASREARATTPVESPDWDPVLREAGFDPARLESVTPQWTIGVDSDRRAAWLGTLEGQPAPRFHVEAASYQGRLVSFELRGLWADPAPEPPRGQLVSRFDLDEAEAKRVATASLVSLSWAVYFAAAIRAWRSLRLGRGDRRGAMKAALLTFVAVTLADLVRADHASDPVVETSLLFQILSQGMFGAASVWLVYMALEPAVRRRWPEVLISWNRLLDRRFRDPMCGRDALIGIVAGAGMNLARMLEGKRSSPLSVLAAPHHVLYYLLIAIPEALLYGIAGLFLLYLLRLITRNALLSQFALFVVFLIPSLVASGWTPVSVLNALVVSQVMSRFGLVATSAMWFAFAALSNAPLTLDPSSWYAGRSFGVLGLFVVLVTLAAWTSLGGKPIFAAVLLDDD